MGMRLLIRVGVIGLLLLTRGLQANKLSNAPEGMASKRYRAQTEKGLKLMHDSKLRDLKSKITKRRKVVTRTERDLADSTDQAGLRNARDSLEHALGAVSDAFHEVVPLLNDDEEATFGNAVDTLEQGNLELLKRLIKKVRDIEQETGSGISKVSCRTASSRGSQHSCSSTSRKRVEAAAEVAALQAKLKYIDTEACQ